MQLDKDVGLCQYFSQWSTFFCRHIYSTATERVSFFFDLNYQYKLLNAYQIAMHLHYSLVLCFLLLLTLRHDGPSMVRRRVGHGSSCRRLLWHIKGIGHRLEIGGDHLELAAQIKGFDESITSHTSSVSKQGREHIKRHSTHALQIRLGMERWMALRAREGCWDMGGSMGGRWDGDGWAEGELFKA